MRDCYSISAEEFWQELINRRKLKAEVLPLYNANGKPYWYVMTEKMIKASEVLCREAVKHQEFDPYRMEMTSAMTWEMYFTSYVEGIDIDINTALDYLSKDTEPGSIYEQILFNNKQALSTAVSAVFHPIDETLVKHIAFLLTQDIDGTAMDYRTTYTSDISFSSSEKYDIPDPDSISERMNDLYIFLSKSNIHPLLKSAIAQAYILAARPFSEGNERLSRIISSIILYRSGYDYFIDISLSGKIAKESYRYYMAMQEILDTENDGDITGHL